MGSIENLFEIIKDTHDDRKLTAWRFVAVLVTIVLCFWCGECRILFLH